MAKKYSKATSSKSNKGKTSRSKRMDEEQVVHDINLEMQESSCSAQFEETISVLAGVQGVGKSKFAAELGFALQRKYNLSASGTYFLQCERINHRWNIRKSILPTWPTFRKFVDMAESNPKFVASVKMFVLDVIDGIIPKGVSTICRDLGIDDLKDATQSIGGGNWHAKGWEEFRKELLYQILRLANLGPGVLILSHERYKDKVVRGVEIQVPRMDVSNSIYNALSEVCTMVLHMRTVDKDKKGDKTASRCLAAIASNDGEAKDNLNVVLPIYPSGVIGFKTEKEAVGKLLGCFNDGTMKKTGKKSKKCKKKVKRVKRKER